MRERSDIIGLSSVGVAEMHAGPAMLIDDPHLSRSDHQEELVAP